MRKGNDISDIKGINGGIVSGRPVLVDYNGYWED